MEFPFVSEEVLPHRKCVPCMQNRCECHNLLHMQCFKKAFFPDLFSSQMAGLSRNLM